MNLPCAVGLVTLLGVLLAPAQEKPKTKLVFPPGSASPDVQIQTQGREATKSAEARLDPGVIKSIDAFFASLQKKEIDAAYDDLTKETKIAEKPGDVLTLKSKTQQAIELFGDLGGAEQVDLNQVGSHLIRVTYVSLGKELPLRWRFYFYRASDRWKLIDIRVDDRLMEMFGETAAAPDQKPSNWPKQ